jgi:hypothetical protein
MAVRCCNYSEVQSLTFLATTLESRWNSLIASSTVILRKFLLFPAPPFPFSPLIVTPPALEEEVEEEEEPV